MTLDDLERPKRTLSQKRCIFWSLLHIITMLLLLLLLLHSDSHRSFKCRFSKRTHTYTPHFQVNVQVNNNGWWNEFFYRQDALSLTQPTASKHWRINGHKFYRWQAIQHAEDWVKLTNKKAVLSQMTTRCALYMDALKIFESPWLRPWLLFLKLLTGFCCDRSY